MIACRNLPIFAAVRYRNSVMLDRCCNMGNATTSSLGKVSVSKPIKHKSIQYVDAFAAGTKRNGLKLHPENLRLLHKTICCVSVCVLSL
jgi:hypothetical protein